MAKTKETTAPLGEPEEILDEAPVQETEATAPASWPVERPKGA